MPRIFAALIAALGLLAPGSALAEGPIDLEVLYLGNAGTDRADSYEAFLRATFARVRVADRDSFDPATVGSADVVLLDWSQRDLQDFDMKGVESPLGPRASWSTPTVLLGSAGLIIAGPWQTSGSYG